MMLYSQLGLRTPRSFTFCGTETVPVSFEYKESILDLMFIYCPSKNASILNLRIFDNNFAIARGYVLHELQKIECIYLFCSIT